MSPLSPPSVEKNTMSRTNRSEVSECVGQSEEREEEGDLQDPPGGRTRITPLTIVRRIQAVGCS